MPLSLHRMAVALVLCGKSSPTKYVEEVRPFEPDRWGVWAVSFPHPMESRANARMNLLAVLPDLKARWEDWKLWHSGRESGQLS